MADAAEGVVLLYLWASPYAMRARIALEEKGVPYELREENLADKSALLLASNPVHKKVPVLVHGSRAVCESLNIVQYVDEVWPGEAPLLPSDPFRRSQARFWADFVDKKIFEAGSRLWKEKGETLEATKKELLGHLRLMEEQLEGRDFFGGETFGLVDVMLAPMACWFYAHEKWASFSTEEECPEISAWAKRCMARESVAKSLPDPLKVHEFVGFLRKKYGVE